MVVRRFETSPDGDGPVLVPIRTDQFREMIELGFFREGSPIELIDGMLVYRDRSKRGENPTMHYPAHATGISNLQVLGAKVEPFGCHLRTQLPVTIPEYDEPEPDGAVVRGDRQRYARSHPSPGDVLALMEISESSLNFDRTTKQRVYATANMPIYWIVNLVNRQVEVYESPRPAEGRYEKRTDYKPGQTLILALEAVKSVEFAVSDLLPDLIEHLK